jgi:hypothetical protein
LKDLSCSPFTVVRELLGGKSRLLGHELLGIVTEDKANHLIPSVPRHQFIGHALAFRAHQLVTNSRAEFVVHFGQLGALADDVYRPHRH